MTTATETYRIGSAVKVDDPRYVGKFPGKYVVVRVNARSYGLEHADTGSKLRAHGSFLSPWTDADEARREEQPKLVSIPLGAVVRYGPQRNFYTVIKSFSNGRSNIAEVGGTDRYFREVSNHLLEPLDGNDVTDVLRENFDS